MIVHRKTQRQPTATKTPMAMQAQDTGGNRYGFETTEITKTYHETSEITKWNRETNETVEMTNWSRETSEITIRQFETT